MKHFNEDIIDIHLMLMYYTSWNENVDGERMAQRSWKAFTFDYLDRMEGNQFIRQNRGTHYLELTKKGIRRAKRLIKKFQLAPKRTDD